MERQYFYTERAHLMCPNMNFGIVCEINSPFSENRIRHTLSVLVKAHPFLTALLGYEEDTNRYFYNITSDSQVDLIVSDENITGLYDKLVISEYERLVSTDWNLTCEGMLKIVCWKQENKLCILFVFHHLLADGRAALSLVQEFAEYYVYGELPESVEEKLISSVDDFPDRSELPFISKILVDYANKRWKRENHQVSYEAYYNFANKFLQKDKVTHDIFVYDEETMSAIRSLCRENLVSVNDYLTAKMFEEDKTDKIIIASDLRKQLHCYSQGALGNYATAFSVRFKGKNADTVAIAGKVHKQVQKIMKTPASLYLILQCYARLTPSLIDAAAISTLGNFDSKAGRFIGTVFFGFQNPMSYSITNLGKIESRSIDNAIFIPPASPAVKKIKGILTVNGRMNICVSQRDENL
ncbi:MAG: condensation domain-containing protein [Lachnospiraceae bacterium]|nr:condensation domain-containing protein [Lachnospiraceae bacterium]